MSWLPSSLLELLQEQDKYLDVIRQNERYGLLGSLGRGSPSLSAELTGSQLLANSVFGDVSLLDSLQRQVAIHQEIESNKRFSEQVVLASGAKSNASVDDFKNLDFRGTAVAALAEQQSALSRIVEQAQRLAEQYKAYPNFIQNVLDELDQQQANELSTLVDEFSEISSPTGKDGDVPYHGGQGLASVYEMLVTFMSKIGLKQMGGDFTAQEIRALVLSALISLIIASCLPDFTSEDREDIDQIRNLSENTEISSKKILKSVENLDFYYSELRRKISTSSAGVIRSQFGRIRSLPTRRGEILERLPKGAEVTILTNVGQWREVAFVSPEGGMTRLGWIWGGSLEASNNGAADEVSKPAADFAAKMKAAEAIMREDRDILRELAK